MKYFVVPVTAMLEHPDKILLKKVTDEELVTYAENLESLVSELWLPVISCSEHHLCGNTSHSDIIDKLYHKLIYMIHLASSHLPHTHELRNRNVLGWIEHCRELYSKARQK